METRTKHKRWAAMGLVAGMMIGGGALANAATKTQSTPTPSVNVNSPAEKVAGAPVAAPSAAKQAEAPGTEIPDATEATQAPEAAGTETNDATEAPEAAGTETKDATEADGGVDCENGIVKGTGAQCDGGPSANQDDGSEGTEAPESAVQK